MAAQVVLGVCASEAAAAAAVDALMAWATNGGRT